MKRIHDMLVKSGWHYDGEQIGVDTSKLLVYSRAEQYPNLGRFLEYKVWVKVTRYGIFSYSTLWGVKYNAKTKQFSEVSNLGEWTDIKKVLQYLQPRFEKHHNELLAKRS